MFGILEALLRVFRRQHVRKALKPVALKSGAVCCAVWRILAKGGAVRRCDGLCGAVRRCAVLCSAAQRCHYARRCLAMCGTMCMCDALCGFV